MSDETLFFVACALFLSLLVLLHNRWYRQRRDEFLRSREILYPIWERDKVEREKCTTTNA